MCRAVPGGPSIRECRQRPISPTRAPLRGRRTHVELEQPTGLELYVRQDRDVQRLAVQSHRLDIDVGRGVSRRGYDKPLAVRQVERELLEQRAADHVIPRYGIERIEPHRCRSEE